MAKLTAEERSQLARAGGVAKAASQKALLSKTPIWMRESATKRLDAAGREITTGALLREIDRDAHEAVRHLARFRSPKRPT